MQKLGIFYEKGFLAPRNNQSILKSVLISEAALTLSSKAPTTFFEYCFFKEPGQDTLSNTLQCSAEEKGARESSRTVLGTMALSLSLFSSNFFDNGKNDPRYLKPKLGRKGRVGAEQKK